MNRSEVLTRTKQTLRAIAADVKRPPAVPPGHFYSPATSPQDVSRAIRGRRNPVGIDLRLDEQVGFAKELRIQPVPHGRWQPNGMYSGGDAAVLRAMLLRYRPKRLIEVGSGYSTAVALDVTELPDLAITCVEPYADRLRSLMRPGDDMRVKLTEEPVQNIDPAVLATSAGPGSFFFIDSTHVVKAGSDVCWLLLHVLPLLPVGTVVHIHDVHWPFEYPDHWLEARRDWTEAYFVHAFLLHNHAWQIRVFNSWLWETHSELIPEDLRGVPTGSIWLERVTD